ncbi:MAG: methyltransferase domain-containing protein [Terriglobia bacterium]
MQQRLLEILACPECRDALRLEAAERQGEEILSGVLRCAGCAGAFPVRGGIPRFVTGDTYVSTFSFEWKRWQRTQLDTAGRHTSRLTFTHSTGKQPEDLAGRLVLDAGCGTGRYMDVAARAGAEIVGVDLSFAIEVARQNLAAFPRCHFVQADLNRLPFRPECFDFVYSIGVLHHTPDTRTAFLSLVKTVQPGGGIAIWVYPRYRLADAFRYFPGDTDSILRQDYHFTIPPRFVPILRWSAGALDRGIETSSDAQRFFTTRLPARWLYEMCHVAIPLYYLYRIPLFYPLRLLSKISMDPNPEWRVLETFDWYSPRYQWKHSFHEVLGWFEEAGLREITPLPRLVAVSGVRPRAESNTS